MWDVIIEKKNFYEQKSQTLHPDAFIVPLAKYETKLVLQSEMEGVEAIGFPWLQFGMEGVQAIGFLDYLKYIFRVNRRHILVCLGACLRC